jgi:6-phosphofructokinase 2
LQQNPSAQYEINAVGPLISNNQLNQIVDKFLALCQHGIGILTGSLPPGLEPDTYKKINLKLQQQGAKAIIDASAQPLMLAISSNPFLIKPNLHELELLTNKSLTTIEDIAEEARLINKQGTHYICVSLAEKGAILVNSNNSYYCQPPNITVHSTVGAGDSMVAGLAYAFANKMTDKEVLTLAVACGASTAQQSGTQLFELSEVETLSKQITLKTLDI